MTKSSNKNNIMTARAKLNLSSFSLRCFSYSMSTHVCILRKLTCFFLLRYHWCWRDLGAVQVLLQYHHHRLLNRWPLNWWPLNRWPLNQLSLRHVFSQGGPCRQFLCQHLRLMPIFPWQPALCLLPWPKTHRQGLRSAVSCLRVCFCFLTMDWKARSMEGVAKTSES